MADIPRSPYTFKMTEDKLDMIISTQPIEEGFIEWPVYEVDDKYYLQELFEIPVPKGCVVLKLVNDTYHGSYVTKVTIMDTITNRKIYDNTLSDTLQYPYIAVSSNALYRLKVDAATPIDYIHGNLRFEWSYNINTKTPTVIDYLDE